MVRDLQSSVEALIIWAPSSITRSPRTPTSASASINLSTAAFGALKNLFGDKYLSEKVKGQVYTALVLSTLLYGCEVWPLREDLFSDFGASTTVVPAVCVASASPTLTATASLPKASFAVWESWKAHIRVSYFNKLQTYIRVCDDRSNQSRHWTKPQRRRFLIVKILSRISDVGISMVSVCCLSVQWLMARWTFPHEQQAQQAFLFD